MKMETALFTWWTVNHFFSGVFFGVLFNFRKLKNVKVIWATVITFILLVLWEVFERYALASIEFGNELIRNRVSDVVIGMIGYFIVYFLLRKYKLKILN